MSSKPAEEAMLDIPEHELACRIFEQAIEDYRFLKKRKITEMELRDDTTIGIKEIEEFFHSSWCDGLLEAINSKLTGKDLLHGAQFQYC